MMDGTEELVETPDAELVDSESESGSPSSRRARRVFHSFVVRGADLL